MDGERATSWLDIPFQYYIPFLEESSDAVCLVSPRGAPQFINQAFKILSEYPSLDAFIKGGGLAPTLGQPSVVEVATQQGEATLLTQTGSRKRVTVRAIPLAGGDRIPIGTAFLLRENKTQPPTGKPWKLNQTGPAANPALDILNALPSEIAFIDPQGTILSVNLAWEAFARRNRYQHPRFGVGENYLRICEVAQGKDAEEAPTVSEGIRQVIAGRRTSFSLEYPCHSPTEKHWYKLVVSPLLHEYPTAVVVTHLDITDRMMAEQRLEESKQYYQSLFENHPDAVFSLDLDGHVTSGNHAFARLAEAPLSELLHRHFLSFVAPEDQSKAQAYFMEVCQGKTLNYDLNVVTARGTRLVANCTKMPIFVKGVLTGVFDISRDVTNERKAQAQLAESTRRLHTMLESITDGFYAIDVNFIVTYWNAEAERILKVTRHEAVGQSLWKLLPEAVGSRFEHEFHQAVAENRPVHFEEYYSPLDLWTQVSAYPSPEGLSIYFLDIGDRKRAEERLQVNMTELEKINHELDQFVYRASHDLRAPLASILGLISIAQAEADPNQKNTYLQLMTRSVRKLDTFIQDIIHYSKNARTELVLTEVDFPSVVHETIEDLQYMEEAHAIEFRLDLEEIRGFYTDASRLQVILHNLAANAILYHDPRKQQPYVAIRVEKTGQETATIQVEDNGQGIDRQHQDHIFKMFYRARSDKTGSGLGLYIVAENLNKLNGTVKVDSQVGKGTVFTIFLPNLASP